MISKTKIITLTIFFSFLLTPLTEVRASLSDDANAYEKYPLYSKYEKKQKYDKYKKFLKAKEQSGLDTEAKRLQAKEGYTKYKLYLKDKTKNRAYAVYLSQYNAYNKYKKYSDYKKYKKYKKYNKKEYEKYKNYGSQGYKDGYNRYKVFMNDLGNVTNNTGPEISVGLWSKSHLDAGSEPFRITATKSFDITNCSTTLIGQFPVGQTARVKYIGPDGMLQIYNSNTPLIFTNVLNKVCLIASDGNNADMIFDVNTPTNLSKAGYEQYRGKITIQHSFTDDNYDLYQNLSFPDHDLANSKRRVWVINTLPLEHYMWGYGEMSGGVEQHSKVMITAGRTYARWYIEYANKWSDEGFKILSYSFSQIYNGYDYEIAHPLVSDAARKTNGIVMKYGSEYVLAAYSSYTDGNTRAMTGYPYLLSVPDPYGKNDSMTTEQMVANGNHMWGLSASGSLNLASNHGWTWTRILSYYYSGINIAKEY